MKQSTKNQRLKRRRAKLAPVWIILLLSSGCTTLTSGGFCELYQPIYADYERDTAQTIRQIDMNNVVYDRLCAR